MLLLRKLLIGVALAAIGVSVVASAATGRSRQESVSTSVLLPGVTYTREVDFTSRGPIVLDVVTAPKPDGKLYSLAPALSNEQLRGREPLTRLDSRVARGATTVAIDGDYFDRITGTPNGMLMQNGVLQSPPGTGRSSLGIAADGTLTTGRVSFAGIWQGKAIRRPLLLNSPAGSGKFSLYTPVYGGATPRESGVVEAVIGKLPAARLETPLDGTVTQVTTSGPTPIPRGGAVLVARGAPSTAQLKAEAPVGQQVEALLSLSPDWRNLASAIGGGPLLVRKGKPIFHAGESFAPRQLNSRQARGAIGQLSDGRIVLVGVEGPNPAYSIGMSNYELAVELTRLGATIAYGLGAGSASGIAFDGRLLTRPSSRVGAEGLRRARPLVQRRLRGASVEPCALAERRRRRRHRGVLLSRRPALGRGGDAQRPGRREGHAPERGGVARAVHRRLERHRRRLARAGGDVDVHRHGNRRP